MLPPPHEAAARRGRIPHLGLVLWYIMLREKFGHNDTGTSSSRMSSNAG